MIPKKTTCRGGYCGFLAPQKCECELPEEVYRLQLNLDSEMKKIGLRLPNDFSDVIADVDSYLSRKLSPEKIAGFQENITGIKSIISLLKPFVK